MIANGTQQAQQAVPLRIVVITNMYPPHHLGGYELSCLDVVERWRARGHHVHVLTSTMRVPDAEPVTDEDVSRGLGIYWENYRSLDPNLLAKVRAERANQRALRQVLDRVRPHVVSAWHMGALSLGLLQTVRRRRIPIVLVVGDEWLTYGFEADKWLKTFRNKPRLAALVENVIGLPTHVRLDPDTTAACFNSEWVRQRALATTSWPLDRSAVVYSGIEINEFPFQDGTDDRWSWRLVTVGRVEERKGSHVAIEALARLGDEATLEIVGPALESYLDRLKSLAAQLGVADRVRFLGARPRSELAARYRSADAFLFPVLWDEPFGLVPLEAMASGTPVVATGTGGSGEYHIDGANCLLVPPGDAGAMADAVRRLADDADLRRRLVRAGRVTAAELSVDRLADVLEEWHFAAAARFGDGEPPQREPIEQTLARLVPAS